MVNIAQSGHTWCSLCEIYGPNTSAGTQIEDSLGAFANWGEVKLSIENEAVDVMD